MQTKNIAAILAAAVIILFFTASDFLAQVAEGLPHLPGVVEGTGTHFEIFVT